jgi:hypothetical protein
VKKSLVVIFQHRGVREGPAVSCLDLGQGSRPLHTQRSLHVVAPGEGDMPFGEEILFSGGQVPERDLAET